MPSEPGQCAWQDYGPGKARKPDPNRHSPPRSLPVAPDSHRSARRFAGGAFPEEFERSYHPDRIPADRAPCLNRVKEIQVADGWEEHPCKMRATPDWSRFLSKSL